MPRLVFFFAQIIRTFLYSVEFELLCRFARVSSIAPKLEARIFSGHSTCFLQWPTHTPRAFMISVYPLVCLSDGGQPHALHGAGGI